MSTIRRQVLLRTAFIILVLIPTILYRPENKIVIYLNIIILVYGLYQSIRLLSQLQRFIDDIFPPKLSSSARVEKIHKFFYYGSQVLFYSAIFFHLGISRWTRNTIFVKELFLFSFSIGLAIAIIITIILTIKKPSIYFESTRRMTVHFGIFLGFSLFLPALAIFTNHIFADKQVICKTVKVDSLTKEGRYETAWLNVTLEKEVERFHISKKLFEELEEGEEIQLCTKIGALGFEFVQEIKANN